MNQASYVESYPLPRDIFSALSGGKTFSKLDLAQAYLQFVVDKNSRTYLTINTHNLAIYQQQGYQVLF